MAFKDKKDSKRDGYLTVFLIYIGLSNLFRLIVFIHGFLKHENPIIKQVFPLTPDWGIAYLTITCFVDVVGAYAVWKWKKWGAYLLLCNLAVWVLYQLIFTPPWNWLLVTIVLTLYIVMIRVAWKQLK